MSACQDTTVRCGMRVTYDGAQRCTAVQEPQHKVLTTDACPSTGGKGEELSPLNLVGAGLASCTLLAMGMVAQRRGSYGLVARGELCRSSCRKNTHASTYRSVIVPSQCTAMAFAAPEG